MLVKLYKKEGIGIEDSDTMIGHFDPASLHSSPSEEPAGVRIEPRKLSSAWPSKSRSPPENGISPTSWCCFLCMKTFASKSNLQIHKTIHLGQKFQCSECNKSFTQKCNLKRHEIVHLGLKSFSCTRCSKKFTQKSNLLRHFTIHSGEKNFSCDECGKKFIQKCNLKRHFERHIHPDIPLVECVLVEDSS